MAQYYLVVFKYVSQHAVGVHGSVGSNMRVRKIRTPSGLRGFRSRNPRNSRAPSTDKRIWKYVFGGHTQSEFIVFFE